MTLCFDICMTCLNLNFGNNNCVLYYAPFVWHFYELKCMKYIYELLYLSKFEIDEHEYH